MAICLLLRHGHSTANADAILSGRADGVVLTDRGLREAADVAGALSTIALTRVVTSPLERCRQTAQAVLATQPEGTAFVVDPDLVEVGYGAWTGRALRDLAGEPLWTDVQDRPSQVVFPESEEHESEGIAAMAERMVAAIRRIDADVEAEHGADAVWLAVSHGDPIKAVLAHAAGTALDDFQRFVVEPAGLVAIRWTSTRPFVLGHNLDPSRISRLVGSAGHAADGSATPGGSTGQG